MCFIADIQDYNESQVRLSSTPHYDVHKLDDNTVYVVAVMMNLSLFRLLIRLRVA